MEKRYNYLIIGGGIAGTTAAETIRAADYVHSVAIVEREPHLLYSRVLLPQFAEGVISEEKIFLRQLGDYDKKKIDIFLGETICSVDLDSREARAESGRIFYFDKLLIAAGGRVRPWAFEKNIADHIVRLQTLADAKKIIALAEKFKTVPVPNTKDGIRCGRILIVGGGFVSLDLIDIFAKLGFEVVLVVRGKRFWENILDETGSKILHDLWRSGNIELFFDEEVASVIQRPDGLEVILKRGGHRLVDLVGVGVGLDRNFEMLQNQLEVGRGVRVNEYMETMRTGVWAAGDVTEHPDPYSDGLRLCVGWGESFIQGRVAGYNMTLGGEEKERRQKFDVVSSNTSDHLSVTVTTLGAARAAEGVAAYVRFHPLTGRYARFFLRNNIMIGAALINANNLLGPCLRLIKERRDLREYLDKLTDNDFDIAAIR